MSKLRGFSSEFSNGAVAQKLEGHPPPTRRPKKFYDNIFIQNNSVEQTDGGTEWVNECRAVDAVHAGALDKSGRILAKVHRHTATGN